MPLRPFKLERYFARYEFNVKYLLSSSDVESLSMAELVDMANADSLSLWQGLSLGYTESPGHPKLRAEVASLYSQISPENVLIAAPEEAIFIAMQTLLAPGDHVVAVAPAYQSLHEVANSIGCEVTPWLLVSEPDGWRIDLSLLEQSISHRTKLIILNFPHNPTGHMITRGELDAIVTLARKHGCYIFSDEIYRLLESDLLLRLPPICDVYEKGISLSGLSKTFALPGLRVGWLAAMESGLVERWLTYKDYTTICNSAPSEILAIIALQNKERIIQRNLAIIAGNTLIAEQFFAGHADKFSWHRPRAGSVAFPEWLGTGGAGQFCQDLIEKRNVMLVPGELFDFPGNHFRIGLGRKNFAEAIEQLELYLMASA